MSKSKTLAAALVLSTCFAAPPAQAWVLEAMKIGSTIVDVAAGVAAGKASRAAAEARRREFTALMLRIESVERELEIIRNQLDQIQISLDAIPAETAHLTRLDVIAGDITTVWSSADALTALERYSEEDYREFHRSTIADNLPDLLVHAVYLREKISEGDHLAVAYLALVQEAAKLSYFALAIHSQSDLPGRSQLSDGWFLTQNGACDTELSAEDVNASLAALGFSPDFVPAESRRDACENVRPSFFFSDLANVLNDSREFWTRELDDVGRIYGGLKDVEASDTNYFGYEFAPDGSADHRDRQAWLISTYLDPAPYPTLTPICHVEFLTAEDITVFRTEFDQQFHPIRGFEVPITYGAIVISGLGQMKAAEPHKQNLGPQREALASVFYSDPVQEYLFRDAIVDKPRYHVTPKGPLTARYHPLMTYDDINALDLDRDWVIDDSSIAPMTDPLRAPHTLCPKGADVSNGTTDIRDLIYGVTPEVDGWARSLDILPLEVDHPAVEAVQPDFGKFFFDPQIPDPILVLLNPDLLTKSPKPTQRGATWVNQVTIFQAIYAARLTQADTIRSLDRLTDLLEN